MQCAFCGIDPDPVVLTWRPDGSEQVMSCVACAIAQGVYCKKHQSPHGGITSCQGKGTLCMTCFEELRGRYRDDANDLFSVLAEALPSNEWQRVRAWLADKLYDEPPAEAVLRGVVCEALRRSCGPFRVVYDLVVAQSAEPILPLAY